MASFDIRLISVTQREGADPLHNRHSGHRLPWAGCQPPAGAVAGTPSTTNPAILTAPAEPTGPTAPPRHATAGACSDFRNRFFRTLSSIRAWRAGEPLSQHRTATRVAVQVCLIARLLINLGKSCIALSRFDTLSCGAGLWEAFGFAANSGEARHSSLPIPRVQAWHCRRLQSEKREIAARNRWTSAVLTLWNCRSTVTGQIARAS